MAVTMQKVARYAAVSVATVSRVLNTPEIVNAETRQRVFDAIEALGYRINTAARSLRTQQTRNIAVLLSSMIDSRLVESIETAAMQVGYTLLLCTTQNDQERAKLYTDWLSQQRRVDGVVWIAPEVAQEILEPLLASDVPMISINHQNILRPALSLDYMAAAYQLTRHLLDLGHRRIILMDEGNSTRRNGYAAAFTEANLLVDESLIFSDIDGILKEKPTAIIAPDDAIAAQVYRMCATQGLRIPHDISVVGCGDFPLASFLNPLLTTVSFPLQMIGEQAVNLLLGMINEEKEPLPDETSFTPQLIVRESTAPI